MLRAKTVNESINSYFNNSKNINENMQQAKAILKKNGLTKDNPQFQELRSMLEEHNKLGLMGKLAKWVFEEKYPFDQVQDVFELWINSNVQGVNLQDFKSPEEAYDALQIAGSDKDVRQMIQELPREQKDLLTDEIMELLKANTDLKEEIIDFFKSKSSRYHDATHFYKDLQSKTEELKGWSMQSIKNKINSEDLNVEIMGEKGNEVLVLLINDYKASCAIGSKNWCITTSESMFNSYSDIFSNQYFILDFRKDPNNPKSMIGVTVGPGGNITAAHWRNDENAGNEEGKKYIEKLLAEVPD